MIKAAKVKRYTYSEIFCFKHFGWFRKKSERYRAFLKHCEEYQEKLDVKKLVINQGHVKTITSLLMKPYQIKLVSRLED